MTHDCYSTKRTTVWPQERDGKPGYAIKYQDGYVSWCPEEAFARDYRAVRGGHLSFGQAMEAMKAGKRVTRAGWNRKDMSLMLIKNWQVNTFNLSYHPATGAFLALLESAGGISPWFASHDDMLADDWEEIYP